MVDHNLKIWQGVKDIICLSWNTAKIVFMKKCCKDRRQNKRHHWIPMFIGTPCTYGTYLKFSKMFMENLILLGCIFCGFPYLNSCYYLELGELNPSLYRSVSLDSQEFWGMEEGPPGRVYIKVRTSRTGLYQGKNLQYGFVSR